MTHTTKWVRAKVTLLCVGNAALGLFGRELVLTKQTEIIEGTGTITILREVPNSRRWSIRKKREALR